MLYSTCSFHQVNTLPGAPTNCCICALISILVNTGYFTLTKKTTSIRDYKERHHSFVHDRAESNLAAKLADGKNTSPGKRMHSIWIHTDTERLQNFVTQLHTIKTKYWNRKHNYAKYWLQIEDRNEGVIILA